jgi:hypothetical protein
MTFNIMSHGIMTLSNTSRGIDEWSTWCLALFTKIRLFRLARGKHSNLFSQRVSKGNKSAIIN